MFLLDTGADSTCLHSKDSTNLEIPRERLGNLAEVGGIGGGAEYFNEDATLYFSDDDRIVGYDIAIGIASSATGGLPALLGRTRPSFALLRRAAPLLTLRFGEGGHRKSL